MRRVGRVATAVAVTVVLADTARIALWLARDHVPRRLPVGAFPRPRWLR